MHRDMMIAWEKKQGQVMRMIEFRFQRQKVSTKLLRNIPSESVTIFHGIWSVQGASDRQHQEKKEQVASASAAQDRE